MHQPNRAMSLWLIGPLVFLMILISSKVQASDDVVLDDVEKVQMKSLLIGADEPNDDDLLPQE